MDIAECQAKARAYGEGLIPLTTLPLNAPKQSISGFCDYCNEHRPVVIETPDKLYFVCWRDICRLQNTYGKDWQKKVESTLHTNRQHRLQVAAHKAAEKGLHV